VRFDPRTIRQILATNVDLSLSLMALLSAKQRILAHKLTQTTAPSATEKLAELLLRLTERSARRTGGAEDQTVRLTHDQMAAMIGVTRITVTRILRELSARGAVVTGHRMVRLASRRPLEKLCE
jgi:CRP/FNR family transcriptional regulator, cyclic AMP receptor protein